MSTFSNYHFIYKDSAGRWNEATNPSFVAAHKQCVAVPREKVESISEYLWKKNNKGNI